MSMPAQACRPGFSTMLGSGPGSPEVQTEASCAAVSSSLKDADEEARDHRRDAPEEKFKFSSLLNGAEKPMEPQTMKSCTKDVARSKAKGSRKSTRAELLAFALGTPPAMTEEDEENESAVKIESDEPASNVTL